MLAKGKTFKIKQVIIAALFCIIITPSNLFAELKLESVNPNFVKLGEEVAATLTGSGFDSNTRVSMFIDVGNRANIIGSVNIRKFASGVTVIENTAYVVGQLGLQVIDLTDPSTPVVKGSLDTPDIRNAMEVAVDKDKTIAYVASSNGLQIVDVSSPSNPLIIGSAETEGDARGVALVGNKVYLVDWESLLVIDISDPANPRITGSADTPTGARKVTVVGNTAYVAANDNGLQMIDISDPANPRITGSVDTSSYALDISVIGDNAYIANKYDGLLIIDMHDPTKTSSADTRTGIANGIAVAGDRAYVPYGSAGLDVFDVKNPSEPVGIGFVDTPGVVYGLSVIGNTAYIVTRVGYHYSTLYLLDVSYPSNQNIIANTDGYAFEVTVKDNRAYIEYLNKETGGGGMQILDVSKPAEPKIMGSLNTGERIWGKISVEGNKAYIPSGNIVDITDPSNPEIKGNLNTPGSANGTAAVGNIVYVADGSEGLQVIDVSDSSNPTIIGSVDIKGDAETITVVEKTAYVTLDNKGLQIIDVSDPSNPVKKGFVSASHCAREVAVADGIAYMADCTAGLQIIDVSNTSNPQIIKTLPGLNNSRVMGVTVVGDTIYIASDDSGLQIIDVSNPYMPREIGFADTLGHAERVAVADGIAYVADFRAGLTIVPVPAEIEDVTLNSDTSITVKLPSPQISDHYTLRVFNKTEDDELAGAVTFFPPEKAYLLDTKAIIIRGGMGSDDRIWDLTKTVADYAYKTLLYQGYTPESIYYLSPADVDGKPEDADGEPTKQNLSYAINDWSKQEPPATELLLYFVGHGDSEGFRISNNEKLSANELDSFLDKLQTSTTDTDVPVTFIYDACKSGSFLSQMDAPDEKDRFVITSTLAEEDAWFTNGGIESFSYQFWSAIYQGFDLDQAFFKARDVMKPEKNQNNETGQTALFDLNGDGTSEKDEHITLPDKRKKIRRGYKPQINAPYIYDVSGPEMLVEDETSATFQVGVSYVKEESEIRRVWATIIPPGFKSEATDIPVTDILPPVEFKPSNEQGIYEATYDNFITTGAYSITILAMNSEGVYSLPRKIIVSKSDYIRNVSVMPDIVYGKNPFPVKLRAVVDCEGGNIEEVWAEISPPETPARVTLQDPEKDCIYEGDYEEFATGGPHEIKFYAKDKDNFTSSSSSSVIVNWKDINGDDYEPDDELELAGAVSVNDNEPQTHSFHDARDMDWVKFRAVPGKKYTIETNSLNTFCEPIIEVYNTDGTQKQDCKPASEKEALDCSFQQEGTYYAKLRNKEWDDYHGEHVKYDLKVYTPSAGDEGFVSGNVTNEFSSEPVQNAWITTIGDVRTQSGKNGDYFISDSPGNYTLIVDAEGYKSFETSVTITEALHITMDIPLVLIADINGDGKIDLADAILVLQTTAGRTEQKVFLQTDMNDNRIGIEEAVYILQKTAELR